jgi:hypothetical protein
MVILSLLEMGMTGTESGRIKEKPGRKRLPEKRRTL